MLARHEADELLIILREEQKEAEQTNDFVKLVAILAVLWFLSGDKG